MTLPPCGTRRPRDNNRWCKTQDKGDIDGRVEPVGKMQRRLDEGCGLHDDPCHDDIGERHAKNMALLEFPEELAELTCHYLFPG